ncbi:18487_t:CDS:2 [Dentiscutata erythropus]|uniref:18487_t:CDS:1 n=1 Tax=Dentiscutata erythropus TaxID=1348616 RepID=A0A9N9DTF9_9GLOM|nr:18487_t:CDS:2 [Dentiscutata erythropus]
MQDLRIPNFSIQVTCPERNYHPICYTLPLVLNLKKNTRKRQMLPVLFQLVSVSDSKQE